MEVNGLVERVEDRAKGTVDYIRKPLAIELEEAMTRLGDWAYRNIQPAVALGEPNPDYLMWQMRRTIDPKSLPFRRVVIRFRFTDLKKEASPMRSLNEGGGRLDVPFDNKLADQAMEAHGVDVIICNSQHNVRYLLGRRSFFFFQSMQALGHSRYLPLVVYAKDRLEDAAYIASAMEAWDHALRPFWTPHAHMVSWGTKDAARSAVNHLKACRLSDTRIGIEPAFLPVDAQQVLEDGLPEAAFGDATPVLERLRAVKRPDELELLRSASERIVESMVATINWATPGVTKREVVEQMRLEEAHRGLDFDYCLVSMGSDRNRAPSDQAWRHGESMSIDSGGNIDGYIGDLCRMAVIGEPDSQLEDLLAEVDATQQAVFSQVRAGAFGRDLLEHGNDVLRAGPNSECTDLVIHGMGLVSHEVPFIMSNRIYEGIDCDMPLEAGMVLSVETTMGHASRGIVKLEDTIAVTADGCDLYGGSARGWNTARS